MKKTITIFNDIRPGRKVDEDPEQMDFLMKTIKAVHSKAANSGAVTSEELEKQRANVDMFSRLITPIGVVEEKAFEIEGIKCEYVSPKFAYRTDKIILYCHGGGYISGGLGYARILAAKLAGHTGIGVVSFEYRLAPENPYPAAIEDAVKVWNYLLYYGYGAKDIIVAGDSAGGNLTLELCLRLKEDDRLLPKALVLMSPWTDMRCESKSDSGSYRTYMDKDPLLSYEYVVAARTAYAGENVDFNDPHYSPIVAELDNMPPTLIQVGSNEILRDDSEKLYKKLCKQGCLAKLEICQGGWHVYQQMPIHKASVALDSVKQFIDSIL